MLEFKTTARVMASAIAGLVAFEHMGYAGGQEEMPGHLKEVLWSGDDYADFSAEAGEELLGRLSCECEECDGGVEALLSTEDRALLLAGVQVLMDEGFPDPGSLTDRIHGVATGEGSFECLSYGELERLILQLSTLPEMEEAEEEEMAFA